MADLSFEVKIIISDYYPKIEKIPYDDYDCIISDQNDNLVIPLTDIDQIFFIKKYNKIESDLVYVINVVDKKNKLIISNSSFIIPFMKILTILRMKIIRFEQYIKLFLEGYIKDKILGNLFFVKNLFLKLDIEINLINIPNKNIILFNNIKTKRNCNSKNKANKTNNNTSSDFALSFYNISNLKSMDKTKTPKLIKSHIISRNNDANNISTDLFKSNHKNTNLYKCSIKYNTFYKKDLSRNFSNDSISKKNNKIIKLNEYKSASKINIKKKNIMSNSWYKTHYKNISNIQKISNKTNIKEKSKKKFIRKTNSLKSNKSNSYKNNNIEIKKNKTCNKISLKDNNKKNLNINNSNHNIKIPNSVKKNRNNYNKRKMIPHSNKKINICKYKIQNPKKIDFNYNNSINFNNIQNIQENLKNNIIKIIDYFRAKINEFKNKFGKNLNNPQLKYLLISEKIFLENYKLHKLINSYYIKDIKNFIHVNINTQYNNLIFNKMLNIKKKEFKIINIILVNKTQSKNDPKKIIQEKLKQQKQIHVLLNLIRELIKNYGNLSHLYEEDNKKILLKSLFLRYNIREKEWNKNNNLLDIYNKINNDIKIKNNKKVIAEIKQKNFKEIKEEEEEEIEESKEEIKKEDIENKDKDKDIKLNKKIKINEESIILDNNDYNVTNNEESIIFENNYTNDKYSINDEKEIDKTNNKDININTEDNKENKVIINEKVINNLNEDLRDKKDIKNSNIIINNFILSNK